MGFPEECETGGLIAAAGFYTDEAVFHNIDAADPMSASEGVGSKKELERGCDCS